MSQEMRGARMSYSRARMLLLVAGLAVLVVLALFLRARGVDNVEMGGTLLFIPVFIGFVFWNIGGGVVAGLAAGLGYLALRYPAIKAVGAQDFAELVAARALFYLAFGAIGGWASKQMEASLTKLELYDQIDDATGLYNARFFLQDTDLEMSRSTRYQTIFSIALVDIPATALNQLSRRQKEGALRELGRMLRDSIRTVDRGVYAHGRNVERLAVVLPETGKEGVVVFTDRLAERIAEYLISKGAPLGIEDVTRTAITFPADEEVLARVRSEFATIDRAEHPEEPVPSEERSEQR